LDASRNNFLAAVYMDKQETGLALVDISTGEFMAAQGKDDFLNRVYARINLQK
jgi:DNA mismatch repair protein MutS